MPLHDFFGQGLDLSRWAPAVIEPEVMSPADLFIANLRTLEPLAQATLKLREVLGLDDYGLFRLMIFAVDHLTPTPEPGAPLCPMGMGMGMGHWSPASRLFAIGALARAAGYAVVPHLGAPGEVVLYIPIEDDPEDLNANWRSVTWTNTRDGEVIGEHAFRWLVWDGDKPLGATEASYPEGALLPPEMIIAGSRAAFRMYHRVLPDFTLQRSYDDNLSWFESSNQLSFVNRPDAARYLNAFPQYRFGAQTKLALQEASTMELRGAVADLMNVPEVERMNLLLRTLQHNFEYTPGPLRPLFDVMHTRQGDCDQLSLVFASVLEMLGYDQDDVVAMTWPEHLCLAVRPKEDAPRGDNVLSFDW